MPTITRSNLLSLEAYAKIRIGSKQGAIAHRRLRSVRLGEHINLQFEDRQNIRRQIQEMLHIEKIFDDVHERKRELARLTGVEDRMFVEVEGHPRVFDIADEKTSAVHFVRFEFKPAQRAAIPAGAAVRIGCDHTHYPAHVAIAAQTLASLAGDVTAA